MLKDKAGVFSMFLVNKSMKKPNKCKQDMVSK